MPNPPEKTPTPRSPAPQIDPVFIWPTPNNADLLFWVEKNADLPKNKTWEFGEPYWDATRYPDHKLVHVSPQTPEKWSRWFYASNRVNEDAYNFEHVVADVGSTKYSLVRRNYLTPRASYSPENPAPGTPMPDVPSGMFTAGGFVLAGREEMRTNVAELDSLYVAEVRTYIDRATLSESNFNPSSGISTVRSSNLYYLGEEIDGTPIEDLVADPDNPYWSGDGGEVRYREFQALSENWFLVTEIGVGLSDEPKLSRVFDERANVWVTITETPVEPGTITGTLVGDTLTETKAGDYLQSQTEARDPSLPGYATTKHEYVGPYDAMITTTRQTVAKGSVSPGGGVEIDGSNVQWDEASAQAVLSFGTPTVSSDWDHTLNLPIKITKTLVAKGSAAATAGEGYYIEVQNLNHLIDIKIVVELEGTPENMSIPSVFPYQFPAVLKSARFVDVSCYASSGVDFAYDQAFYLETEIEDPLSRLVPGTLERIFVTASGVEAAVGANPEHDWGAKAHSFGVVKAVAWVANDRCTADAQATQFQIPPTIHGRIEIPTSRIGAAVPPGATKHTNKIILAATKDFGSPPEEIVIDVDVIPHKYGWYEVQVKRIGTSTFSAGASASSKPFTPIGGSGPSNNGVNGGTGGGSFGGTGGYNKWTADANATTYNFQIDDDPAFGSPVVNVTGLNTPSYNWTAVSIGTTYYARSQAVNAAGTSEWSEPWVIFNAASVHTAPTLTSPASGASGVGLPPTVKWTAGTGLRYRLQVGFANTFLDPVINVVVPAGSGGIYNAWLQGEAVYQFRPSTTYWWRLRAESDLGYSDWTVRNFTTGSGLSAVTNLEVGAATEEGRPVTWDATAVGADSYTVYLVASDGSTVLETYTGITETEYVIPAADLDFGSYYARVGGTLGGLTMATEQTAFTVTLDQPAITNLEDGDEVGTTMDLEWEEIAEADDYQVLVKLGGSTIISEIVTATSYTTVTELTPGSSYTVRIIARANSGTVLSVDTDYLTVDVIASTPTITTPATNYLRSVDVSTVNLEWAAAANALAYRYQVATDSGFTSLVLNAVTADLTADLSTLSQMTVYYARVRVEARSGAGSSAWSSTRIFETYQSSLVYGMTPGDGTVTDDTPDLSWNFAGAADDLEVQVSTRDDFATLAASTTLTGVAVTWTVSPALTAGIRYHWRVRTLRDATGSFAQATDAWGATQYFDVTP